MPLLDHFRDIYAPVEWPSVHSAWSGEIMRRLNSHWLGPEFIALERKTVAEHSEIDIATYEKFPSRTAVPVGNGPAVATLPTWTVTSPALSYPAEFPELNEIQVVTQGAGRLVAAIELVSPGNKDRPAAREAFAAKCVDYIGQGVCVVVIDVVTTRKANLHNEVARRTDAPPEAFLPDSVALYAATYRPTTREGDFQVDLWTEQCGLGQPLPKMPLRLTGDTFVPVEFELTYAQVCQYLRLAG
jgi:Protein of unknown function (DUF4058)